MGNSRYAVDGDRPDGIPRLLIDGGEFFGTNCALREILRLAERVRELEGRDLRTFDQVAADKLADEVAALVTRGFLDSRSAAADALLDYREPPRTERSDRIAALEEENRRLRMQISEQESVLADVFEGTTGP